ncbi:MAG: hypothetical protein IAB76_04250 [Bacteroidetes bacterium]|uniref:Right handed beta helix domain-containing protein n=1 Tax=Candidatus Cryptobacteroides avistercoris TaxID=2840758 RepID=A0A9D9IWE2_9BACT|nr:hypothetical protein [Candidatus Cryptobacteroides avistercoris]
MKTSRIFMSALMAALMVAGLSSCNNNGKNPVADPDDYTLGGRLTEDLTLKQGETYMLESSLQVVAPATLTIEPGVTIIADESAGSDNIIYILIEQGARIMAEGTASEPIVMTSENKEPGAWGGLHICGKAHTNADGETTSEIGNAPYGGNEDNDDSGVLKYIRIEYSGLALDSEHEANGISLYGVGAGTQISYIYVVDGSDDGIEFFGGSADIDHCVVENCTDDSYDWTEGWDGSAEYIIAYQSVAECDCLMECDNNGDNNDATPVANPTIRYATFIGNNSTENHRGLRLREGTYVNLSNALVCGKPDPITLDTPQTVASFDNGKSSISNTVIVGELLNEEGAGYDNAAFLADGNSSVEEMSFTGKYVGMIGESGAVSADDNWTAWIK